MLLIGQYINELTAHYKHVVNLKQKGSKMKEIPEIIEFAIAEYENNFDGTFSKVPFIVKEKAGEYEIEDMSGFVDDSYDLERLVDSVAFYEEDNFNSYCFCYPGMLENEEHSGHVITLDYCDKDSKESVVYIKKLIPNNESWKAFDELLIKGFERNRFIKKFDDSDEISELNIKKGSSLSFIENIPSAKFIELEINYQSLFRIKGGDRLIPNDLKRIGFLEFEGRLTDIDKLTSSFFKVEVKKLKRSLEGRKNIEIYFKSDYGNFEGKGSLEVQENVDGRFEVVKD